MIGWTQVVQYIIYFISLYYVVFWLLVWLDSSDKVSKRLRNCPEVTIAIPAYNEEENIVETLKGITNLDYPKSKLKIIFIDDGSKDRTYEFAKKYLDRIRKTGEYKDVLALQQENTGKYFALNNALNYVDTEFFATLDADSTPVKNALKKIMCEFKDMNIAAVSPVLKVHKPKNMLQIIQWLEYSVNHFYKSVITEVNAIHVIPGPLSVYRTKVIREVKGFREAYKTEDMEIAMRIQKRNYAIVQCNEAFVYTKAPYDIKSLYRQRHRWSYGTFRNLIEYRKMMFNKEYGDFGMFQLPVILISGIIGITILGLIFYDFIKSIQPNIRMLQMYHYNVIEYLSHTTFNIIWLDLDLRSIVTFIGFFIITLLILWLSLRLYREKYKIRNILPFVFYIFFYYIFLAVVWLGVFKDIIIGREARWKK